MLILDKQRAVERIMALMSADPDGGAVAEAILHEGAAMVSPRRRARKVAAYEPVAPAAWGVAAPADDPAAASGAAAVRRARRRRRRGASGDPAPA